MGRSRSRSDVVEVDGGGTAITMPMNSSSSLEESAESYNRTGNLWSAIAHIITGVIGAGVLSLSWSVAQLGWIAGPLLLIVFPGVTLVSTFLLCDCYRYPDPETGPTRISSYSEAVKLHLGKKREIASAVILLASYWITGVAYHVTAAHSIRTIRRLNCNHNEGHDEAACTYGDNLNMIIFGALQIILSQIPNLHNMDWLSIVATIMSFCYATIGSGLALARVLGNGGVKGTITGVAASNLTKKFWLAFQAMGDIAFAYPYSLILLEIQDTLKSPPSENQSMKKASTIAIFVTTFFYLCCGGFGYAAFGDDTPGNLLMGFGSNEPFWLIAFANACVALHVVGGYQIYSQPAFSMGEGWLRKKFPDNGFVKKSYTIKIPFLLGFELNLLRVCFRTVYVISTTGFSLLFPFFNQVLGLLGSLNFWPLAIYFPVEMYFKQRKIRAWTKTWILLRILSFLCFLVTVMGFIGSLEGLLTAKFS